MENVEIEKELLEQLVFDAKILRNCCVMNGWVGPLINDLEKSMDSVNECIINFDKKEKFKRFRLPSLSTKYRENQIQ